jgi:hypothetical protein
MSVWVNLDGGSFAANMSSILQSLDDVQGSPYRLGQVEQRYVNQSNVFRLQLRLLLRVSTCSNPCTLLITCLYTEAVSWALAEVDRGLLALCHNIAVRVARDLILAASNCTENDLDLYYPALIWYHTISF